MKRILAIIALAVVFAAPVFAADPHAGTGHTNYMYDTHCALGLTMNKLVACDAAHGTDTTWTDPATNKHYCFANKNNKETFAKDIPSNLKTADANWPKLSASAGITTGKTTH